MIVTQVVFEAHVEGADKDEKPNPAGVAHEYTRDGVRVGLKFVESSGNTTYQVLE